MTSNRCRACSSAARALLYLPAAPGFSGAHYDRTASHPRPAVRFAHCLRRSGCGHRTGYMRSERESLLPLISERDVQLILLDLATPGLIAADWVSRLRSAGSETLSIVAYGPHVDAARLAEARQAGCDRVMARGQFLAQVTAILATDGGWPIRTRALSNCPWNRPNSTPFNRPPAEFLGTPS